MLIKCKQCNAPLQILGNNLRSTHLICQYCGTVMAIKNDFKPLYSFATHQQNSAYRLGKKYLFQSVEYQIVGFIVYQSLHKQWLEYQLYSLTHGYGKLIEKDKKTLFLKRTHYLPQPNVWMLKSGDKFTIQKQEFSIQSFEFAEIYYAAGTILEDISQKKRSKHCFAWHENRCFYSLFKRDTVHYYLA